MKAIQVKVQQGSQEWHDHRNSHNNGSDASAMLGISTYKKRDDFIKEKATGIYEEPDEMALRRFAKGHEYEESARPIAENIIGDDFFPVVLKTEIDGLKLSSSFDGLTIDKDISFEHKTLNEKLTKALTAGEIPEEYHPQMEQGLRISGAKKCMFCASLGTEESFLYAWYYPNDELWEKIIGGWKQFQEDVFKYIPEAPPVEVIGRSFDNLPALRVDLTGIVNHSNTDEFKKAAFVLIDTINLEPVTDQEFADTENGIKFCKTVENNVKEGESLTLAKMESINNVIHTLRSIGEYARSSRLAAERAVKNQKEKIKFELINKARLEIASHIQMLNISCGSYIPPSKLDYGVVIKGLKTKSSIQDALNTAVANEKVVINQLAEKIIENLKHIEDIGKDFPHITMITMDIEQIILKDPIDFKALILFRIDDFNKKQEVAKQAKEVEQSVRPVDNNISHTKEQSEKIISITINDLLHKMESFIELQKYKPKTASMLRKHITVFIKNL